MNDDEMVSGLLSFIGPVIAISFSNGPYKVGVFLPVFPRREREPISKTRCSFRRLDYGQNPKAQ
jgi:hypothetical protein